MSKSRRGRRPGGHPAKVAERRERNTSRDSGRAAGPRKIATSITRQALDLAGPLDAELWGSSLLGVFWTQRHAFVSNAAGPTYSLAYGGPLIEAIDQIGGAGARLALSVIQAVDGGELGLRAGELAGGVSNTPGEALPGWAAELGHAVITDAAVLREDIFDDDCTVFLEAHHPCGEVHAVGVLINNNLGGMAEDILLADSIDRVKEIIRDHPPPDGEVKLERISPGVAAGRIHAALELTDMTWDPPVSDDFADLRALALMRADEAPGYVVAGELPELSRPERDRLCDEFLQSPEGNELAAESEEAYAVSLAIDFCADYVDGRPLRWSPVVVELFMADWIPRKVIGDRELFGALPGALDAWVRFAGRKSQLPEWAIAATREAIPAWHETMVERTNDPDAAGPAKQFLTAAQRAGIDLEDEDALSTFVAGWNARSQVG